MESTPLVQQNGKDTDYDYLVKALMLGSDREGKASLMRQFGQG
ncbi:hypothetical protein KIPB_014326, partial [Kipferlia bialata]|eukprot:g14326.t1